MSRIIGRVKWFAGSEGYGFIESPGASDVFLHDSAIEDDFRIEPGQLVEFEIVQGPKGPMAEKVTRPGNYPLPAVIRSVNDNQFEKEVLLSTAAVLVSFCANWCEECALLTPILQKVANELAPTVVVINLNVDEAVLVTRQWCIGVVPTIILFKGGKEQGRLKGVTRDDLRSGNTLYLLRRMVSDFDKPTAQLDGSKSPYEILNISIGATSEEIHSAYKQMAKQYHPDRVATLAPEFKELAERRMKEINLAYQALLS
jgi:cold shock protein